MKTPNYDSTVTKFFDETGERCQVVVRLSDDQGGWVEIKGDATHGLITVDGGTSEHEYATIGQLEVAVKLWRQAQEEAYEALGKPALF